MVVTVPIPEVGHALKALGHHYNMAALLVAGAIGVVTVCVLASLVWTYLAWMLGWRLTNTGERGTNEERREGSQASGSEDDDGWGRGRVENGASGSQLRECKGRRGGGCIILSP
jgi:hypothetical protein